MRVAIVAVAQEVDEATLIDGDQPCLASEAVPAGLIRSGERLEELL